MLRIFKFREMDTINKTLAEVQELRSEIFGLREQLGRIVPPGIAMSPEDNTEDNFDEYVLGENGFADGAEIEDMDIQSTDEHLPVDNVALFKLDGSAGGVAAMAYVEQAAGRDEPEKEEPDDINVVIKYHTAEGLEAEEQFAGMPVVDVACEELPAVEETLIAPKKREWAVVRYYSRNDLWWKFWKKTGLY
ncbi:MAG: hypothetical protein VR69_16320 [Peptococcaceae bacterium BRH_c4b]|nr:MAG: hypothetical protein VR69_16320 [Peptococcaceae bacterium BRH_c4b]